VTVLKVAVGGRILLKRKLKQYEESGQLSRYSGGLMSWVAQVRFPEVEDLSLLQSAQTDSGAHPVSYPVGTGAGV
jgi:hypothetical protein